MDAENGFCMVNGDFALEDGVIETLRLRGSDGVLRAKTFMKYRSEIKAAARRVFNRNAPIEYRTIPVDVWVSTRIFRDRPVAISANLHGRLYMPDTSNMGDDLLLDFNDDDFVDDRSMLKHTKMHRKNVGPFFKDRPFLL